MAQLNKSKSFSKLLDLCRGFFVSLHLLFFIFVRFSNSLSLSFLSFFRGVFDIMVSGTTVGQYNNKGSFGELALMYNTPRAATIIATQEGALWGLVRTDK